MSTHSRIGIINTDGSVESIYCHGDGYPSHQTTVLLSSYNTEEKVRALIGLGDISYLGNNINPLTPNHTFGCADPDTVVAYHRDRDEDWDDVAPLKFRTKKELVARTHESYIYLFDCNTNKWQYTSNERFRTFTEPVC